MLIVCRTVAIAKYPSEFQRYTVHNSIDSLQAPERFICIYFFFNFFSLMISLKHNVAVNLLESYRPQKEILLDFVSLTLISF